MPRMDENAVESGSLDHTIPTAATGCLWLALGAFLAGVFYLYVGFGGGANLPTDALILALVFAPLAIGAAVLVKPTLARLRVSLLASLIAIALGLLESTQADTGRATAYSVAVLGLAIMLASVVALWRDARTRPSRI